ncbi:MAG: chorismate mutase [Flavobacteriales bacterium]
MRHFFSTSKKEQSKLIIAGPCSAESKDQLFDTAQQLKQQGIENFRAGIWKPRTRPNSFEGIGFPALEWMKEIKSEFGMQVSTEVASAKHVEACLKADFDGLWIGARTTVNPFLVQEIAEALRGVKIPVFIKNPIHAEIGLWIGAIERFQKMGIENIGNIFRGFHTANSAPYRNEPKWKIALEIKRLFPDLPLLCDPSHISGRRDLILPISQTSYDLNFDGLMIETHRNPDEALSDANQQLTPSNFKQVIDDLVVKNRHFIDENLQNKLANIRTEINQIDYEVMQLLSKRFEHTDEIGYLKKENDVRVFQLDRYQQLLDDHIKQSKHLKHLDERFIKELFELVHKYSIAHQTNINTK